MRADIAGVVRNDLRLVVDILTLVRPRILTYGEFQGDLRHLPVRGTVGTGLQSDTSVIDKSDDVYHIISGGDDLSGLYPNPNFIERSSR